MPTTPFVPASSTCQFRILGEYYGDTIINDIHIKKILSNWTDAEMNTMAGLVETWWENECLPLLNVNYLFNGVEVIDISVPLGRKFEVATASLPGGVAGDGCPGNVTYRMYFHGTVRTRGGHHGISVSGIPKASQVGNHLVGSFPGDFHAAVNLLGPLVNGGGTYFWATVSKVFGGAPRTTAFVDTVMSTTYSTKTHTMGKRVNGK